MMAIGADTKADPQKVALLLTCAGQAAIDVYNTFEFPASIPLNEGEQQPISASKTYATVITAFDGYCKPKTNESYERYVFRNRTQKEGETFDAFLTDLKLKIRTCNYAELKNSIIRDQIIYGIANVRVKERLLRESELTLSKAVEICQASEASQRQMAVFTNGRETIYSSANQSESSEVHAVKTARNRQNMGMKGSTGKGSGQKKSSHENTVEMCIHQGSAQPMVRLVISVKNSITLG